MLDVSSRLADDKRNDIRIEAALAKLYSSELGWLAVDEMVQVRGGRAYETAEAFAADAGLHLNAPDWFAPPRLYGFVFREVHPVAYHPCPGQTFFFAVEGFTLS